MLSRTACITVRQGAVRSSAASRQGILSKTTVHTNHFRLLSSMDNTGYTFGSNSGLFGGSSASNIAQWPTRKTNTILNVVPQGKVMVVERLGKLLDVKTSGYFFAIPFIDQISYVIDLREIAIDINPQSAITKDNVSVAVSGNVYIVVVDPERAAYGARDPLYAIMQHAQSAMRSAIGEMELDEILHERARLNTLIKGSVQEAAIAWGIDIKRYEITEIVPDEVIRVAMDKQAAAERNRREKVLNAQGEKQQSQLTSEGVKIQILNEAEALKEKLRLEAEGESQAIQIKAEAQAKAIALLGEQIQKPGGAEAAKLSVARDYVAMYGEMGSKSNTMMFNDKPADVNALLAQAALAISSTSGSKPSQ